MTSITGKATPSGKSGKGWELGLSERRGTGARRTLLEIEGSAAGHIKLTGEVSTEPNVRAFNVFLGFEGHVSDEYKHRFGEALTRRLGQPHVRGDLVRSGGINEAQRAIILESVRKGGEAQVVQAVREAVDEVNDFFTERDEQDRLTVEQKQERQQQRQSDADEVADAFKRALGSNGSGD